MIAWLAGIVGAYACTQWGLKASSTRVVFYAALGIALLCLLLAALLLHMELVQRRALAEQGHEWPASREASVMCMAALLVAALLLLRAALVSRSRALGQSPIAWRTVQRCCLGAAAASGVSLPCAFLVEDELLLVCLLLCFPTVLLVWYVRSTVFVRPS